MGDEVSKPKRLSYTLSSYALGLVGLLCTMGSLGLSCKSKSAPADAGRVLALAAQPPIALDAGLAPAPPVEPSVLDLRVWKLLPQRALGACVLSLAPDDNRHVRAQVERFARLLGIEGRVREVLSFFGLGLVDPFDAASRGRWGIVDTDAAAFALFPGGRAAMAAFPVRDGSAFADQLRKRLTKQGLETATMNIAGRQVLVGRAEGTVRLALLQQDGFAIIVPAAEGESIEKLIEGLVTSTAAGGLATSPLLRASLQGTPRLRSALAFVDGQALRDLQMAGVETPEEKATIANVYDAISALGADVRVGEADVAARLTVRLTSPAAWTPLFPATTPGFPLLRHLPSGGWFLAKSIVPPRALLDKLLSLEGGVGALAAYSARQEKALGLHFDQDLLARLPGPMLLGVHRFEPAFVKALADKGPLAALRHTRFLLAATVSDEALLWASLDRAKDTLRLVAKPTARGKRFSVVVPDFGPLEGALVEGALLLSPSGAHLEAALAMTSAAPSLVDPQVRQTFEGPVHAASFVDLRAAQDVLGALHRPARSRVQKAPASGAAAKKKPRKAKRGKVLASGSVSGGGWADLLRELAAAARDAQVEVRFDGAALVFDATLRTGPR